MADVLTLDDYIDFDDEVLDTDDRDFKPHQNDDDDGGEDGGGEGSGGSGNGNQDNDPLHLEDDPRIKSADAATQQNDNATNQQNGNNNPGTQINVFEKFLERYNVVGGLLETTNGKVSFNELDPEQQLKALVQIVDSTRPTVEQEYALNESELGLLNAIRTSKLSVEDFMVKTAQEYSTISSVDQLYSGPEYKFEEMSPEEIYSSYIKANNSDLTDEQIQEEIDHAKASVLFKSTVEALRRDFITNRDVEIENFTKKQNEARLKEVSATVPRYVDAANRIGEIDGWPVNDDVKNDILESLVEVDAVGKSEFIRSVVENPENAFKAMWYLKNGANYFSQLDQFYKGQLQKIYDKGIEDGKSGKQPGIRKVNAIKHKDNTSQGGQETLEDFLNN